MYVLTHFTCVLYSREVDSHNKTILDMSPNNSNLHLIIYIYLQIILQKETLD